MKDEISVKKLIEMFTDMANKGSLLAENASKDDLLMQIVGVITKIAMEK